MLLTFLLCGSCSEYIWSLCKVWLCTEMMACASDLSNERGERTATQECREGWKKRPAGSWRSLMWHRFRLIKHLVDNIYSNKHTVYPRLKLKFLHWISFNMDNYPNYFFGSSSRKASMLRYCCFSQRILICTASGSVLALFFGPAGFQMEAP